MPRGVDDVYVKPAGTTFVDGTVAEAVDMNTLIDDMIVDKNTARPISVGGTGSTTATAARTALGVPTGTSGAVLGFLNGANTVSGAWDYTVNPTITNNDPRVIFVESDASQSWSIGGAGGTLSFYDVTGASTLAYMDTGGSWIVDGGLFTNAAASTTPGSGNTTVGCAMTANGVVYSSRTSSSSGVFNRNGDGIVIAINESGTNEGGISVSGTTVAVASFCGVHWSQLQDHSKPDIKRGTIVETIDKRCEWPDEENDQLAMFKVSGTEKSKRVYGVFMSWDNDDDFNDANIASLGAFLIRIEADQTVKGGDLIESAGNGCGRVQSDDIFRASTVAKVTCTDVVETFEDGSYLVPCTLHCG